MNLTVFGLSLGTLPAWIPVWAIPLALVHIALFAALIVPAWVGLARARAGGALALVLALPILGLLMLCPIYMNRVLPYAHWGRFWGIFVLIPGINIFFLWIFAFAPWKRRYIPLDQEEYSEHTGLSARRDAPKRDARTGEPVSQTLATPDGAPAPRPQSGPPKGDITMVPGGAFSPPSGEPAHTMMSGATGAAPRPGAPASAPASAAASAARTGPPAEPPIMLPGGPQTLDTPIAPMPPIPARSMQPPSAPPAPPPAAPPAVPVASPEPPRPRMAPRTQDLTFTNISRPPVEAAPVEAATVRVAAPGRVGGRAWRLVGANDVAATIDFTVQEAALLEAESGLLIGRSARANFVIDHDSISRNHVRLLLERGTLCLEDLDSMNGTWVDGVKLEANSPVPLQPNGIVEIGKIRLRVTGG